MLQDCLEKVENSVALTNDFFCHGSSLQRVALRLKDTITKSQEAQ